MLDLPSTTKQEKNSPHAKASGKSVGENSQWPPKCNTKIKFPLIYQIGMCTLSFLSDLRSINSFLRVLR